jgi:hypothetical protein
VACAAPKALLCNGWVLVCSQEEGGLSEESFVRKFSDILKRPPSELTKLFLKVSLAMG